MIASDVVPFRSHEDATVEGFVRDPDYAAAYLDAVLREGDEAELRLALQRLAKARLTGGV